jgi:hypothetical protein
MQTFRSTCSPFPNRQADFSRKGTNGLSATVAELRAQMSQYTWPYSEGHPLSQLANYCRRDVIDPALLAQSAYVAMAVQHGYTRINATRTSLTLQVRHPPPTILHDTVERDHPS